MRRSPARDGPAVHRHHKDHYVTKVAHRHKRYRDRYQARYLSSFPRYHRLAVGTMGALTWDKRRIFSTRHSCEGRQRETGRPAVHRHHKDHHVTKVAHRHKRYRYRYQARYLSSFAAVHQLSLLVLLHLSQWCSALCSDSQHDVCVASRSYVSAIIMCPIIILIR